jgi:2-polyprenyl-3-methyl-5-hydroxy-6-metoxy-1,4-benzoquinol methylase
MKGEATSERELLELQQTLYASKNPTRRWLHESRRDWILDAIRRHKTVGMRYALEIGPGSGVYLPALAGLFEKVVATDIASAFLTRARSLADAYPNIVVVEDDIISSELATSSFDLVLCSEVIEHITDSNAALKQINRVIKPGGIFILSTPQKYSLLEIVSKIAFLPGIIGVVRWVYHEPIIETGHVNLLTAAEVRTQLRQAGFAPIESHVSGLYLPLVAEFFGQSGLRWSLAGERMLRRIGSTGPLWTQFYVAVRSS